MAWAKRGNKRYYYKSLRRFGRVKRIYCGTGSLGQVAAGIDELRRSDLKTADGLVRAEQANLERCLSLTQQLREYVQFLMDAALLASGYHRPWRHAWRYWRNGRRIIDQSG